MRRVVFNTSYRGHAHLFCVRAAVAALSAFAFAFFGFFDLYSLQFYWRTFVSYHAAQLLLKNSPKMLTSPDLRGGLTFVGLSIYIKSSTRFLRTLSTPQAQTMGIGLLKICIHFEMNLRKVSGHQV